MPKKEREKESKGREATPQVMENRSAIEERERRREGQGKWGEARLERRGEEDPWLLRVLSCQRG